MLRYFFVFIVGFLCNSANAVQWIKGNVTAIEVTYMPATLFFYLDAGNAACPAGKAMKWESTSTENNKVIHSTVMAAMLAGKKLNVVINDNDTSCVVRFIYILNE